MTKQTTHKATAKARSAVAMLEVPAIELPEWVIKMHQHYRANGAYRPEDLRRVLGDPRESFQVEAIPDPLFADLKR